MVTITFAGWAYRMLRTGEFQSAPMKHTKHGLTIDTDRWSKRSPEDTGMYPGDQGLLVQHLTALSSVFVEDRPPLPHRAPMPSPVGEATAAAR